MSDLQAGLTFSAFFTLVIALIELAFRSKNGPLYFLTFSCFLYFIILCIGNCATTLAASLVVNSVFKIQEYPGYPSFWYSFIGVFAFEVIIQNINITFLDKGVLTISSWINKAGDAAVASIIRYAADSDVDEKQEIATTLIKKTGAQLPTYALQALGQNNYNQLVAVMRTTPNIDQQLFLALALAEHDLKKAKAIIKSK